jgi:lipoate-protein ligase A
MPLTLTSWRLLDSGEGTGSVNMALDELLARRMLEEGGVPLLRLFRWKPWAVSLGYNQSVADIDAEACHRDGIDIVRRPTGGRAILHAEELTYSVVMQAGRRSVLQVYNEVSAALVRGIGLFGVEVSLQKSQPNFRETYRQSSSVPCFTSSARYEIEWNGRKLVGSAQRRFGEGENDVVLQHGSLLCGPAHRRLGDYLAVRDPAVRERVRREMEEKTIDLAAITGREVDVGHLAECIRKGFELEWGVEFREIDLPPFQEAVHEASQ